MKITPEYLKKVSKKLLETLDRESIKSTSDIEKNLGKSFPIINPESHNDIISIESMISNSISKEPTRALVLSYISYNAGIPLKLKLNTSLNYSKIILVNQTLLEGYCFLDKSPFHNIMQEKKILSFYLSDVRKELEKLESIF